MNKNNYSPYGTFSLEKIDAPKKLKKEKSGGNKFLSGTDLRGGKKNGKA